jgi:hypothetical protein
MDEYIYAIVSIFVYEYLYMNDVYEYVYIIVHIYICVYIVCV